MGYRFIRKGLDEIAKLSSLSSKSLKEEIFEEIGTTVQNYARKNAPVDTHALQRSINHYSNDKAVIIWSMVKYASAVEYWHSQTPWRFVSAIRKRLVKSYVEWKPFLKPAFTEHKEEILKKVKAIIKNHL